MIKPNGFTLIELLITIAIVATLSAIAIPTYLNYIDGSEESVVRGDLLRIQQEMEREYGNNNFVYSLPSAAFYSDEMAAENHTYSVTLYNTNQQYIISAVATSGTGAYSLDSANVMCFDDSTTTVAKDTQAEIGSTASSACPELL